MTGYVITGAVCDVKHGARDLLQNVVYLFGTGRIVQKTCIDLDTLSTEPLAIVLPVLSSSSQHSFECKYNVERKGFLRTTSIVCIVFRGFNIKPGGTGF